MTDGLVIYIDAVRKAFRTRQSGTGGRPRLIPWPELATAQVVKQYAGRAVTGSVHRLVHGNVRLFLTLLWSTPGCQVLNTAYIERLNGTFRSRLAVLGRRTRRSARRLATVAKGMYLVGTLYNFCTLHDSRTTEMVVAKRPRWPPGSATMSGRSANCCTIGCRPRAGSRLAVGGVLPTRFRPSLIGGAPTTV